MELQALNANVESAGSSMPSAELVAQFSDVIQSLQTKIGGSGTSGSIDSQVTSMVETFDTEGTPDGKLNASELADALGITEEQAAEFIETFNTTGDTDGALDAEELLSAYETVGEATEASSSSEGSSSEGSGGGSGLLDQLLELLDKNGDGVISEEEAQDFIEQYAGADGKLSMEELKEGLKAEAEKEGVTLPEISDEDLTSLFGEAAGDGTIDASELATALNASAESET